MSHLVRRQSDSPSFSSVVFLSDDRDREGHLPPLCSLWDESALPAALHLAQLSCSKPTVCALHHSAWRSATILAAASRGEQRRRGSEWKRDGIERERGRGGAGGQSEWMTDAPWLRLCPPFIGSCRSLRRAGGRTEDAEAQVREAKMKDGGGTERRGKKKCFGCKEKATERDRGGRGR